MAKPVRLLTLFRSGMLFGMALTTFVLVVAFWGQVDRQPTNRPADQRGNAYSKQEGENPVARWWRWTLTGDSAGLYTFGLIAVGTLQVWLFYWQLGLIRVSLADTKKAAKAAKRQAKLARDTLVASQRSWIKLDISVPEFNIKFSTASFSMEFDVRVTNVGGSPAQQVVVGPVQHCGESQLLKDEFLIYKEHVKRTSYRSISLFPGESVLQKDHTHINFADFAELTSNALMIACFYKDGVEDVWRETSFTSLFAVNSPLGGLPKSESEVMERRVYLSRLGPMTTIS